MTPIEKNIKVVDEHGNSYEATYLRRAKGLVKNGRARFTSNNTICLACPPKVCKDESLQVTTERMDINMPNKTTKQTPESATELNDDSTLQSESMADVEEIIREVKRGQAEPANSVAAPAGPPLDWILKRMDLIMNDTFHIQNALGQLAAMDTDGEPAGAAAAAKAEAITDVVKCRETTNQQVLRFLEKMYDDLKPQKPVNVMDSLLGIISQLPPDQKKALLSEQMSKHR